MECTVEAKALSSYLSHVAAVAPKRSVKEILSLVMVTVGKDSIEVKATNLNVELRAVVSDTVEVKKEGVILVNAEKLNSIIKSFRSEKCSLKTTTKNLVVKCGKSVFKLALGNVEEYIDIHPEKKLVQSCKLETDALEALINNVSFAADNTTSDVTFAYDTILLEGDGEEFKCVAADGTRLSYGKMKCEGKLTKLYRLFSPKAFPLLKKLNLKQTHVIFEDYENVVVFKIGDYTYSIRPVIGKLPNYEKKLAIPNGYFYFDADRAKLLSVVRQMLVISSSGYNSVWLKINLGKLLMYTDVIDNNEAKVEMDIESNVNREFLIKLNAASLNDVVRTVTCDTIRLIFTGEEDVIHVTWDDYHYFIMPLIAL